MLRKLAWCLAFAGSSLIHHHQFFVARDVPVHGRLDLVHRPGLELTNPFLADAELLAQILERDDILGEVVATTDITTVMMPYASAVFSRRIPADRPRVLPDRAANFAFLGQFTDLPEDVVFTVEYSVRGAMHAVYGLFGVEAKIPPIYRGLLDPKVGLTALQSAFR